jgi:carboxymethylenebutenolidase
VKHSIDRALVAATVVLFASGALAATPETVTFESLDAKTRLTGYLYLPRGDRGKNGSHPAVVMLHGRAGAYSSLKRGMHTAEALSARHRMWGEFWSERGYVALLVDSFGPRGYGDGFPKHSYRERPDEVSERFVRPLDAYGALRYLRQRADVDGERVGIQGWSNGGMTVLSTIAANAPGAAESQKGFRAAIAQYPGCRTQIDDAAYKPYAPLFIFAASEDDEVSPAVCRRLAERLRAGGEPVEFELYDGAQHSYDDPGKTKQSHTPNRAALVDTRRRAEAFFEMHLKR